MGDTLLSSSQSRMIAVTAVLASGVMSMVACGEPAEQNETEPAASSVSFDGVDDLFSAVDRHLECPEESSGDYHFALPDREAEILKGRSCAESVVMAWSEDEELLAQVRDMMSSAGGPVSVAESSTWFVADITEVAADGEATDLAHPGSRDLQGLAEEWDATYTQR